MAKKFTRAERAAYHSGKGYAVAHFGRGIAFKDKKTRESFQRGYSQGLSMMRKNPSKYKLIKKLGKR